MRLGISIIFILLSANITFSQALKLDWMDKTIQKNFITTIEDSLLYSFKATAKGEISNASFTDIDLLSSVKFIQKTDGHSVGYCTKICYAAFDTDFDETMPYSLEAGTSSDAIFRGTDGSPGFQIYLYPFPPGADDQDIRIPGVTIIRVKFVNVANPENDYIEFDIRFEISVDGANSVKIGEPGEFNIYPNPANDFVKVGANEVNLTQFRNSSVKIYDMLGNIVKSIDNFNLNEEINISNLATGRYIQVISNSAGQTYSLPLIKN